MRVMALLAAAILLAGCSGDSDPATDGKRGSGSGDVDPFAGDCDFPQVSEEDMGDNAAYVGGVHHGDQRLQGVEIRAVAQDGSEVIEETTNQAGCYYLSVFADVRYDITWQLDGYQAERRSDVTVPPGEKRIRHIELER